MVAWFSSKPTETFSNFCMSANGLGKNSIGSKKQLKHQAQQFAYNKFRNSTVVFGNVKPYLSSFKGSGQSISVVNCVPVLMDLYNKKLNFYPFR